jgi:hypothetical protein
LIRREVRVVHQNHKEEKNSPEFFDCAPPGAAALLVINLWMSRKFELHYKRYEKK